MDVEWGALDRGNPLASGGGGGHLVKGASGVALLPEGGVEVHIPLHPLPLHPGESPQLLLDGGGVTFLKAPFWVCGEVGWLLRASGALVAVASPPRGDDSLWTTGSLLWPSCSPSRGPVYPADRRTQPGREGIGVPFDN